MLWVLSVAFTGCSVAEDAKKEYQYGFNQSYHGQEYADSVYNHDGDEVEPLTVEPHDLSKPIPGLEDQNSSEGSNTEEPADDSK